jgi:hypothetical protein
MHPRPGDPHWLPPRPSALELLGPAHPLVRVEDQLKVLFDRSLVVAALLCAGVAARLEGVSAGHSLTLAAGVVETVLGGRAALLAASRRDRALDLIVEGRGDLPIDAVAHLSQRLLDPKRRDRLAASFDDLRDEAGHPPPPQARVWPIFNTRVITAAAPELTTVARLLRDGDAGLRGVAMAQRLLTDGGSSLYRSDLRRLQDELHRIQYHLAR